VLLFKKIFTELKRRESFQKQNASFQSKMQQMTICRKIARNTQFELSCKNCWLELLKNKAANLENKLKETKIKHTPRKK
jgi:hypothetical protein